MQGKWLMKLAEAIKNRSKKPWARFETSGINPEEGLGVAMYWNTAFIMHLHSLGIQGTSDQETMQLFFLFMSSKISENFSTDTVNPVDNPNLSDDANLFVR